MTADFAGRNVLVTGASRGIGAATALRFAAEGANVAVTARTLTAHEALSGSLTDTLEAMEAFGGRHVGIVADLLDPDDRARIVPEAVAALGPIEILVNNAAAAVYQPMAEVPLKRRRLMMEINLHAPIDLMQAVTPSMVAAGEGWIVNLSSGTGRLKDGPPFHKGTQGATTGFYGSTKAALNRFSNALAMELHPAGVRVNTVEPRAAVMSEGADAIVGQYLREEQIESMEAMVEAILAVASAPADRTGRVEVSLDLLDELGITVMELDGSAPYPGGQRRVAG